MLRITTQVQRYNPTRRGVAWKTLKRWMGHLESRGEMLRISRPVDVVYEAGAIADLLVKNNGPAVLFEKPRLADGTISKIPLVMNIFGSNDRKALPLVRDALAMPPRKKWRGNCQRVRLDTDLTKLPIPKTWPMDGGHFVTLPLVVTKDPNSGEHNLGMYRAQVFGPEEIGLHWQIHKHGADHAAATGENQKMPVAICMGGPPELIFSAIAPLPDNLSEYQFAGILGSRSLRITKALTQDLMVPAEADIVIEGYCVPGETRLEGPFGDHFGFYSLTGQYPVMHVTAITARKDAVLPATIVGLPPMEDGYLGEAIGRQFSPVLQFQHRDVKSVHLPLETGFHNLAIVASKQRYPRQARKTALGLLGAGQMMFLKVIIAVDPEHNPKDLEALLDALNDKVEISQDVIILDGMVADSLDASSPYENVHSKLIIDATTIPERDPRSPSEPLEGSFKQNTPEWRQGLSESTKFSKIDKVKQLDLVSDARMLRDNILVVTTDIVGTPSVETGSDESQNGYESARIERISQLKNSIWQLDSEKSLRWLFITNDDMDLNCVKARRRLLWQLTSRFDVGRGLFFDDERQRLCWDATTPIPSDEHGVRRWPAITLHSDETLEKVAAHPELAKYEWPPHLEFGGSD